MHVRRLLALLPVGLALANVPSAGAQEDGEGSADVAVPAAAVDSAVEEDPEQDAADFGRELRTVEEEVDHLKERVFRSKATLQLLKELITEGATVGSRLNLWHVNKLGGGYTMESIQYFLDGKNVFSKVDPGGTLDTIREFKVHEQAVPPGTHNLQVHMVLRGKGYRIFSYLRTYQFKVQSSYSFRVEDGRLTVVRAVADTKGGLRNFVDRPDIQFDTRVESLKEP